MVTAVNSYDTRLAVSSTPNKLYKGAFYLLYDSVESAQINEVFLLRFNPNCSCIVNIATETKCLGTNWNLAISNPGQFSRHKYSKFECCSQWYSTLGIRVSIQFCGGDP